MELAEGGGERDINDRRGGGGGGDGQQVLPQQPPLPCPRCDSLNTKFCYYNNYSLAQPRYYCKTCKRHWTKGGTMRNVPVGGGSRKRAKIPPSSSRPQQQPPHPPPQETVVLQPQLPNLTAVAFDQGGGGYLSSLAAIHSLQHPFDQSLKLGGDVGGSSSNLGGLVPGFNVTPLASQSQIRPSQFYQREVNQSLYNRPADQQGLIIPSSMAIGNNSAASQSVWPRNFINNANNMITSDDPLWNTVSTTTSISGNGTERNGSAAVADSPLIPNQYWPDFPGYGPPPP